MASAEQQPESLNIQLLVDSIPALIHTARPDGYLDYFNKHWLEYLGAALDDVAGWKWKAFVHPEDVEGIVTKWRACLATGEIFEYETRIRRANGEYRWMLHRKVPLRDANGNIVKWYGSSLDIEERKTAEEQVRRNAEKLQGSEFYLAEGQRLAHMGSWAFDAAGFDYWSPELFRIHGLDPSGKAPTVQEYMNLVHPEDRGFVEQAIQKMLADHRGFDFTKRIVRPDGTIRSIRCVGGPATHGETFLGFFGTGMDVTEQEQLTKELQRREAYLAKAQTLSHTGSFGWNVSTDEHFWSEETFRIFEFAPSSKVSLQMILECIHPEDMPAVKMTIAAATRGEGIDIEPRLMMSDGRIKYLHVVGKAERRETGSVEVIGAVMDVTARKQTEVELRRSKAHLADAQTLSRTGSVGMEVSTKRIFWSEEAARIYGYPPRTEPTPNLILQRSHPDDVGLLKDALARAAQGGSDFNFEHRLLMPDGSIKHLHDLTHCFQDEAGNEEIVGAIMDITERKLAEESLRESEERFRLVLESIGAQVVTLTLEGEVEFVNQPALDYFGKTMEQLRDWRTTDFIHPDDLARAIAVWKDSIEKGLSYNVDHRCRRSDGVYRWFHVRGRPHRDAQGSIVRWYTLLTDVDERKRAEQKLGEQEGELRQILDLAPQLVAVYGPNRERIYANRVLLDYVGQSLEEWRQSAGNVHPDDNGGIDVVFGYSVTRGSADELEMRLRKRDGSYRWFLARFNPLQDELGQITRWYITGTDIDDRKQAEDALRRENVALREEIDKASMFEEIVGTSPALKAVLSRISKVAPSDSTVLITGETGTGKELFARAIHRRSNRSARAFISVNCAAIPHELIASELFGHEKGAFTGATQQRLGRFELANGGTLFLDEVGELPAETQIALLRVLQEHEFERVGGTRPVHTDVRVIAATNRELQAAISAGSFRTDLFYRLNVFPIEIPPLRERGEDIPLLVEYFIDRYARKAGKKITTVDKKTLRLLESYPWPGNIRELQNVIERSVIVCETENLSVDESWLSQQPSNGKSESQLYLSEKVAAQEKEIIEAALRESQGRVFGPSGAAAKLGIARSTLESKIRSLKINKNRFRA